MIELGIEYEFKTAKLSEECTLTYRTGPLFRMAFCSCGWRGQVDRRKNALGATSKLRAMARKHVPQKLQP